MDNQYRTINERKHAIAERINRYSANSTPKQLQITDLKERKRKVQARIEILEAQLGTPLQEALSTQETNTMAQLQVGALRA